MKPITRIRSRSVVLPATNVDTDQIIPARFLTTTTREGLGRHAFADWRYHPDGSEKGDFILNKPEARGCGILVAGRNFGCGSSREHAPWALLDYGLQAVVSSEIADIFRSNALKNGLLPVVLDEPTNDWLLAHPGIELTVDLENTALLLPDGRSVSFPIEPFARFCLLNGVDQLGYLLNQAERITAFEGAAQ